MRVEDIPGIKGRKAVHAFVKDHVSMLFEDVRGIIVQRGYNFACANLLVDLLSGLSGTLFKPANSSANLKAGSAFKALLRSAFFLWDPTDSAAIKEDKIKAFYTLVRNPLTHALGVDGEAGVDISIGKKRKPLTKRELSQMEKAGSRPGHIAPALTGGGKKWMLSVEGLHYAVFRLFWNIAQDKGQMDAAESRFAAGEFAWRKF